MKKDHTILTVILVCVGFALQASCQQQAVTVAKPAASVEKAVEKPAGAPETEPDKAGPEISFDKTVHDFGEIDPGSKHHCEFKFKNTGSAFLEIDKTRATCGCTALKLDKKEYAPGETGTIKVRYTASKNPGKSTKHIYVTSNDTKNSEVKLSVNSNVILKVSVQPEKLKLSLNEENAGCPEIVVTSIDSQPFSIKKFSSTGNSISADFDPEKKAAKFVLQPKVDTEKLRKYLRGSIQIHITHPKVDQLTVTYSAPSDFEPQPKTLIIQNAVSEKPVKREIWVLSNYDQEFEIESITSKNGSMKLLEQKALSKRIELNIEITPPQRHSKLRFFRDTLYIKIKDGPKLQVTCNVWYSSPKGGTPDKKTRGKN